MIDVSFESEYEKIYLVTCASNEISSLVAETLWEVGILQPDIR